MARQFLNRDAVAAAAQDTTICGYGLDAFIKYLGGTKANEHACANRPAPVVTIDKLILIIDMRVLTTEPVNQRQVFTE
jgi:hypothetical protein